MAEPFYGDQAANLRSMLCEQWILLTSMVPFETCIPVKDFSQGLFVLISVLMSLLTWSLCSEEQSELDLTGVPHPILTKFSDGLLLTVWSGRFLQEMVLAFAMSLTK